MKISVEEVSFFKVSTNCGGFEANSIWDIFGLGDLISGI